MLRATSLKSAGWRLLLVLALCSTPILFAQQQRTPGGSEAKWETLTGCRLETNSVVDGDSFHVLHRDREYLFRLYFVDAPEGDANLKDRIRDQAAYFGIAPDDIPRAAKLASRFTRDTLSGTEFTVLTRWQNSLGRSSLARFYAVVFVKDKNLAEELIAHGLGRIYGLRANWPGGPRSTTFINQLKNRELTAREKKLGVWDETQFPRQTSVAADGPASTNAPARLPAFAAPMDLNTATFEELQELPGIGPKLAEQIIAHRPFKTLEDLDKVPGIGPKTLERLRPLIRVGSATP